MQSWRRPWKKWKIRNGSTRVIGNQSGRRVWNKVLKTILNRYIFLELFPPFLVNLIFFTFIFLLTRILDIMDMVVNYGIGLSFVTRMILYIIPYFLVFVIPMSVMLSVLLTCLRMSSDNEIIALKACGISIYSLVPPVLLFSVINMGATGFMIVWALPWGKTQIEQLTIEAATQAVEIGITERSFETAFKNTMIYVSRIDPETRTLHDVLIEKRENNTVISIVAPRGSLVSDQEKPVFRLKLKNGMINQVNVNSKMVNSIRFADYEMRLDLARSAKQAGKGLKDEKEMFFCELAEAVKKENRDNPMYYQYKIEFHRKFSIPFACIFLGILAVPLGVRSRTSRKSYGLILGLFFFLLYYLILSAGLVFGETGAYPPLLGMWMPNILTFILAVFLLEKTANDNQN